MRVLVVGAGPIGLEMAAHATREGFDVVLLEKGSCIASNIREWEHVELFSPWSLNMSEVGKEILQEMKLPLPQMDLFPTGSQYISSYLEHLEQYLRNCGKCQIHLNCEVLSIGRSSFLKREHINSPKRQGAIFRALIYNSAENKEQFVEDVQFLVDCSGTWNQPNHAGIGGIPALGETRMISAGLIRQHIPNKERDGKTFLGKKVALIGSGASAITSLNTLSSMANEAGEDVEVVWIVRRRGEPYTRVESDPLPQRDMLYSKGNEISRGNGEILGDRIKISYIQCANVLEFREKQLESGRKAGITLSIQDDYGKEIERKTLEVDVVISNCGFRPNTSIWDELQVHQCYASSGPMKLAAGGYAGDEDRADLFDSPAVRWRRRRRRLSQSGALQDIASRQSSCNSLVKELAWTRNSLLSGARFLCPRYEELRKKLSVSAKSRT